MSLLLKYHVMVKFGPHVLNEKNKKIGSYSTIFDTYSKILDIQTKLLKLDM